MRTKFYIPGLILLVFIFSSFLHKSNELTDISIGDQIWSSSNLNVTQFKNGDEIKQCKTDMEWLMADVNKEPAWCYYNFDESNNSKYGKLYNGHAVLDKRGLAPQGWRLPTDNDWEILSSSVNGRSNELKMAEGNSSGFSAVFSSNINVNGMFGEENFAAWWTCSQSEQSKTSAFYRKIYDYNDVIERKLNKLGAGLSVRLIKE